MGFIEELRSGAEDHLDMAQRRMNGILRLEECFYELRALGMSPLFERDGRGFVCLRLDIDAIDVPDRITTATPPDGVVSANPEEICLGGMAAPPQADPEPPSTNITPSATPAGVNADIEAGAGLAADDGLSIVPPPEVSAAQVDPREPAPADREAAVAEKPPAPPATAPKKSSKPKGWAKADEYNLAKMKFAGRSWADIAKELDRTAKACKVRWQRIKGRDDVKALSEVDPAVAPEQIPAPAEEKPAPVADPAPIDLEAAKIHAGDGFPRWVQGMVGADYEIASHLVKLPEDVWFPPGADLTLATVLARGDGAGAAADALGLEKPLVLRRWSQINTKPSSIDHQTRLLRILRVRADAACMPA